MGTKQQNREYYLNHKDEARQYYIEHRAEILATSKERWKQGLMWTQQPKNKEAFLEIKRRFNEKYRDLLCERAKDHYERNRERLLAESTARQEAEPLKRKARNLVQSRERSGLISKEPFCEFCPSTRNLEYHHPDYSEPLITVTCCSSCHKYVERSQQECN